MNAEFTLNVIFLIADPTTFSSLGYQNILNTLLVKPGSASVTSVQPDILTGLEARRDYFPNITSLYAFQLVHVTRVQADISSADDAQTLSNFQTSLASSCLQAGLGIMAIDSTTSPTSPVWLLSLPPLVAPIVLGVWILTMISCSVCWLVYFLCAKKQSVIVSDDGTMTAVPAALPVGLPDYAPSAPPLLDPSIMQHAPSAPPLPDSMASFMRMPFELARSANQFDPYARPTQFSRGPAAVRLASWPSGPTRLPL